MDLCTRFGECIGGCFGPTNPSSNQVTDLVGKVMIVTGGNRGIGFSTVQQFARRGAKVYLAARSKERALKAIARLRPEGLEPGNGEVLWLELDLALPTKVQNSAATFLQEEKRLVFMFTKALLPLMADTARLPGADVRIIVLTSIAMSILKNHEVHLHFRNVDDVNKSYIGVKYPGGRPKDSMMRYAQSKLVNILYAKQLQKTLDAAHVPITVMAVHPGNVWTEGFADAPVNTLRVVGPLFAAFFKLTFLNMDEVETPPNPHAESAELVQELWDTTEGIIRSWEL